MLCVEFSLLFQDYRIMICFFYAWNLFVLCCNFDALPYEFRKTGILIWVYQGCGMIILLVGLHFDYFPDIVRYHFKFQAIEWQVEEIIESTLFTIFIWILRFGIFTIIRPREAIFLKMTLKRNAEN